jgi:hypothetical protein
VGALLAIAATLFVIVLVRYIYQHMRRSAPAA